MISYFKMHSKDDIIYHTEQKTKKWEEDKKTKTDIFRNNSNKSGESVESVLKKKMEGYGGKDLQKRKVLSLE